MTKQELDDLILSDVRSGMLYIAIAFKYGVGTNRVQDISKANGLTRKRGPKLGSKKLTTQPQEVK